MTVIATTSKLASLAQVELELGLPSGQTTEDVYLNGVILQASSVIESYLDRTLAAGSYTQGKTFQSYARLPNKVFLVKYPIISITEVSFTLQDGTKTVLTSDYYFIDSDEGILTFTSFGRQQLIDGLQEAHSSSVGSGYVTIEVEHIGGYDLPGATSPIGMALPEAITRACIDLVKNAYYTRTQNPTVKSEMVPDVLQQTYFQSSGGSTGGGDGFVDGVLNSLDSYLDLRQAF